MRECTAVALRGVAAGYAGPAVVRDLHARIAPGRMLALLGPSGCGKTTVLRVIAGLLHPFSGDVLFDGVPVTGIAAERREAAMVFQKPLLFPWLTVAANVAFGLRMRRMPKAEIDSKVTQALELVQMGGFGPRRSAALSGGQEQRVSIARALVTQPRVLLLDEPFSALDAPLRAEMRRLIRNLQRSLGITTVFVTHDQQEAAEIADEIALMLHGTIEQAGAARALYEAPGTAATATFFGWQRWMEAVYCRPEHVRVAGPETCETADDLCQRGTVRDTIDAGTHYIVRVETFGGHLLEAHTSQSAGCTDVQLRVRRDRTIAFPKRGE